MQNDPNAAVYSSSSVMTYSNTGDGQPKVYQASSQIRQAPGGVKETCQMIREEIVNLENLDDGIVLIFLFSFLLIHLKKKLDIHKIKLTF